MRKLLIRGCLGLVVITGLALVGLFVVINNTNQQSLAGSGQTRAEATIKAAPTPTAVASDRRLLMTYFYYWYDATSQAHLREVDGLTHHLPPQPAPSWRNVAWFKKELSDMGAAGIDVVLPAYWGFDRPDDAWSSQALPIMAQAWQELTAAGQPVPKIGLFFDTAFLNRRDLTTVDGMAYFYTNIREYFRHIPRTQWALINDRPIIFLFTSDSVGPFSQATFDYTYQQFAADFGVRPYIVREVSWDYPTLRWQNGQRVRDYESPIKTDNSYLYAAAIFGYVDRGGVATIGPGYDDRKVPGRNRAPTEREQGNFYRRAFDAAIASGKPLIVIETWNEIHEGSGISETIEFGRQYIDITREYAARFHRGAAGTIAPPGESAAWPIDQVQRRRDM